MPFSSIPGPILPQLFSRAAKLQLAVVLIFVIFVVDVYSAKDFAVEVLYVAPLLIAAPALPRGGLIVMTASTLLLTLFGFVLDHGTQFFSSYFIRPGISILTIGISAILADRNKRVTERLQELVYLLSQSHDALFICTLSGRITSWSVAAQKLYGWREHEVVGQRLCELISPEMDAEAVKPQLLTRGIWESEYESRDKYGQLICVLSRWTLLRSATGEPLSVMVANKDITEHKKAFEALRCSEMVLANTQRLSRTGSLTINYGGEGVQWSAEALALMEWSDASRAPDIEQFIALIHADDCDRVRAALSCLDADDRRRSRAARHDELAVRMVMEDGCLKHLRLLIQTLCEESGSVACLVAITDETSRVSAESALLGSQAQLAHMERVSTLGELSASLAHEINQPLASIATNGEAGLRWLNRSVPNYTEVELSLKRVSAEARRASDIVQRIRSLTRKSELHYEPVELVAVLGEAFDLIAHETLNKEIKLERRVEVDSAWVNADRIQLQQVAINLLVNAIEAMECQAEERRRLIVELWPESGEFHLCVQDNGSGIDEAIMGNLFDAFFSTKASGMGMGLSICRSIIEAHGGRIWARHAVPRGAAFHIALPALDTISTGDVATE